MLLGHCRIPQNKAPARSGLLFIDNPATLSDGVIAQYFDNTYKLKTDLLTHVTSLYCVTMDLFILFGAVRSAAQLIAKINQRRTPDSGITPIDPYKILDLGWITDLISKYERSNQSGASSNGVTYGINQEQLDLLNIVQSRFTTWPEGKFLRDKLTPMFFF